MIGLLVLAALAGYIIYDSTSQPTGSDLPGNFKEVALYRNPNNTGPIIRIYAATVADIAVADLETYGNLMPYTKYGETTVYFFPDKGGHPTSIQAEDPQIDPEFQSNCLAVYHKDSNGQVSLTKAPFK